MSPPIKSSSSDGAGAMDASAQMEGEAGTSSGRQRFRRAATTVAHLCGLVLNRKSYTERSPVVQWAMFYLKRQMNIRSDLLFNLSDYCKNQFQKKGFEKLKHLLHICPKQRRQQDLLQIQACLKTNRGFHCLPSKIQLQLCQAFIYQEYEAGTIVVRQGHVATECYLVLSGKLKIMIKDADFKIKSVTPEMLYEAEEGDFIGETCLLTNTKRLTSVVCKSNAELLVIEKEDFKCILADLRNEQHHATCSFLRAGTTVVTDSLNSYFLVVVKSVASPAPRFLKIRALEQSDIFGLEETMDKLCALQLSLISEGAECIFIPKKLFLENAPAKSRQIASEMVSSFPTENMIEESYIIQQVWTTYKTTLVRQHLEKHASPVSSTISSWKL
ncbi:hypothetical protein lerEdw1_012038 [Lerista edwardsae]|nr:hypothetical protein lerEdw1_012038 [Lerista edwardsae]